MEMGRNRDGRENGWVVGWGGQGSGEWGEVRGEELTHTHTHAHDNGTVVA